ncbi:hypothetical protein [Methyloglobulus sp.]|uniref:hypothetical protein n=1 Tax=Methyloglobulus sp. TaxID=2518622 RepID=UPI0032B70CE1
MSLKKIIKSFESDYYRIFSIISFNSDAGKWMGKIRIMRKDTDEVVRGGFRIFDEDKKNLEKKLVSRCLEKLPDDLSKLGNPYEWQNKGREILLRYLALKYSITSFGRSYREAFENVNSMNETERTENFVSFWNLLLDESVALTRSIELLTEEDRCNMLRLPKFVFDNLSDPWNLDEIDSRLGIYRFILNPSQLEKKTYNNQKRTLRKHYKKLGWS